MASPLIFLTFLLSAALLNSVGAAAAQQPPTAITGQLCCTGDGNCPGLPIPGVSVTVSCAGAPPLMGRTNAGGFFSIDIRTVVGSAGTGTIDASQCIPSVALPLTSLPAAVCTVLSLANGILESSVGPSGQILGFIPRPPPN